MCENVARLARHNKNLFRKKIQTPRITVVRLNEGCSYSMKLNVMINVTVWGGGCHGIKVFGAGEESVPALA